MRPINYARGKVLGGGSAINMCAYTVGPKADYERWAVLVGDSSFGWDNVTRLRKDKLEAFDETISKEHRMYAAPEMTLHGKHGALGISIPGLWESPVTLQLEAAKVSELGLNLDINSGNPLGMATVPSTAKAGLRSTATKAYLENPPNNLEILTETVVAQIILKDKKAIGVRATNREECNVPCRPKESATTDVALLHSLCVERSHLVSGSSQHSKASDAIRNWRHGRTFKTRHRDFASPSWNGQESSRPSIRSFLLEAKEGRSGLAKALFKC